MSDLVRSEPPRLTAIVCQGILPEADDRCGRTFTARGRWQLLDQARAAGWRIGQRADGTPDAMCPDCGGPDTITAKLARDLGRSVQR